jgi:hypothetical protein
MHLHPLNAAIFLILIFGFGFFGDWIADQVGELTWLLSVIALILYKILAS